MKLLITGGCGFLGSNLAAAALAQGYDLTVFDNLERAGSVSNLAWLQSQGALRFAHGDIRNQGDVMRVVRETMPDVVFHLAGQVAMTTSLAEPRRDFEVNALGTLNVLEALRSQAPKAGLVYSSTNKVYGDLEQYSYRETDTRYECVEAPSGFNEETPLDFHSPYGCSKGAADQYVRDYARMFGLRTVVLRHSSMYGGRQYATYDQGWIGWFCGQALLQAHDAGAQAFTISGSGKQVRDVLHADDMVALYYAIAAGIDELVGEAFNVGGGMANSLSLLELFACLEDLLGEPLRYRHLPPRESDQRVFVADIAKLERMLDWRPQVGAVDGVSRVLAWLQETEAPA